MPQKDYGSTEIETDEEPIRPESLMMEILSERLGMILNAGAAEPRLSRAKPMAMITRYGSCDLENYHVTVPLFAFFAGRRETKKLHDPRLTSREFQELPGTGRRGIRISTDTSTMSLELKDVDGFLAAWADNTQELDFVEEFGHQLREVLQQPILDDEGREGACLSRVAEVMVRHFSFYSHLSL